jgi:UDP-N-acetylmuramate dehydrogenase
LIGDEIVADKYDDTGRGHPGESRTAIFQFILWTPDACAPINCSIADPTLPRMEVKAHHSLKSLNTFGLEAKAERFVAVQDLEEARESLTLPGARDAFILGGGSNILITKDVSGLVIHNQIGGITDDDMGEGRHVISVGAGVVWHDLVMYAVQRGYGGIENLSLIPGSCGAAPMQNIGAYGVEIKEVFHSLDALHIPTGEIHTFQKEDCRFGYRESVFKRERKGQYLITHLHLILEEQAELNTSYGAIQQELEAMEVEPSIQNISQAVINIRKSKLPDPAQIGNAGSFFKNPVLPIDQFEALQARYPDVPNYPAPNGRKVAAGWLIEQAGWKGKDLGGYGVHDRQALVLVNRGGATGEKLYAISQDILDSVQERFGVQLEREVNII